jgi:RloB-like protein
VQMRREAQKIARRKATRQGLPSVLIVCEGRETGPNYIEGLCNHLDVNMAAIRVVQGDNHTNPVDLVKRAQKIFIEDGGHDFVYVICDGDAGGLAAARELAQRKLRNTAKLATTVQVVASNPCIEFWLLLHFEYSAAPCTSAEALTRLRGYLTGYDKAEPRIFEMVASGLDRACQNTARLKVEHAASGAETPYTDMPLLVERLREMKNLADQ